MQIFLDPVGSSKEIYAILIKSRLLFVVVVVVVPVAVVLAFHEGIQTGIMKDFEGMCILNILTITKITILW